MSETVPPTVAPVETPPPEVVAAAEEAKPAEPKRRGFWSRLFGIGRDEGDSQKRDEGDRQKQDDKRPVPSNPSR
jgi:hypothetical protein